MLKPSLKEECIALRVKGRHSLREIHRKTGVSRATLSILLRPYPLTALELAERRAARVQGPHRGRYKKEGPGAPSVLYLMAPKALTRADKARVAEAAVTVRLALKGFRIFRSAFEGDAVDIIVITPRGRFLKLQVKWACTSRKGGLPFVRLLCANGRGKLRRYVEGEFDFVVGYDLYSDKAFVWSWSEVQKYKTTVTTCDSAAERWSRLLE